MDKNAQPARRRGPGRPRLPGSELQDAGTVQALERGLILLKLLAQQDGATLTDISLQVGLPASTVYRLLCTLQKQGFVEFDSASQEWAVGIESYAVGSGYLHRTKLVDVAQPIMRALMQNTGETANLAVINEQGEITFITQVDSFNAVRAFHLPGTRSQAHCSGIGKALLAERSREQIEKLLVKTGLPRFTPKTLCLPKDLFDDLHLTYQRGWSMDDEECHLGMRCIAAAIHDAHDEAVVGISISGPVVRFPDERLAELGAQVRSAAAQLTRRIGGTVPEHGSREDPSVI